MARISPTLEGFRAAWRRPSLTLAEIAWRWCVGFTASALPIFCLIEYLNTLPVTEGESVLLRTGQPFLIAKVIARILQGSVQRFAIAMIVGAIALTGLWILATSIGRAITVRELIAYFAERGISPDGSETPARASMRGLLGLNFLRVVIALAGLSILAGAMFFLASGASDAAHQRGPAFFLLLPLSALVCWLWWELNWLLSLAAMFVVRDGNDVIASIFASVTFIRDHAGSVLAVSTWTGIAHLVALSCTSSVAFVPLGFAPILPWRVIAAAFILTTLAYFAVADWLYMARLAGYVCIAEMPEELASPPAAPVFPSPSTQAVSVRHEIDREELILSDI